MAFSLSKSLILNCLYTIPARPPTVHTLFTLPLREAVPKSMGKRGMAYIDEAYEEETIETIYLMGDGAS
ncbi:MAG: hypothetical protein KJ776_08345, partial [Proteobacteria bacterium]|nr:hypothetical protein [Pseudomonadota bacterium]